MREYRQLTEEDRIEIYAMKQAGKEQNRIAAKLGVHPSTISRELSRNTGMKIFRDSRLLNKGTSTVLMEPVHAEITVKRQDSLKIRVTVLPPQISKLMSDGEHQTLSFCRNTHIFKNFKDKIGFNIRFQIRKS